LLRLDPTLSIYGLLWSPDNQNLFYLSMDGTKDVIYALAENLWSVSNKTGERTQLTYDIDVSGYQISWDNHWFFLSGYSLYEPRVDGVIYDLWLLSMDGNNIYRLTANNDNTFMGGICPDGTSLVIWSSDQLMLLNLNSGDIIPLEFDLSWNYSIGGIK
jgi:Tol biopolymer transport system component